MDEKMEMFEMPQFKLDSCHFREKNNICVCFVDNILFWARDQNDICKIGMLMRKHKEDLEQEDSAAGFACVLLERNAETDLINMQRTNLTGRGIEPLRLDIGFVNRKAIQAPYMPF